jgi:hypothetical protein
MKIYRPEGLLGIINRAEIASFVAEALLIEFPKPAEESRNRVPVDLTNCRSVNEDEIAKALVDYAEKYFFEIHFPHQTYADCWLYQGTLHKGPAIRVSVTNHSNNGMGRTSIIHITATLEPR